MIRRNIKSKQQIVNVLLCGNTKLLEEDVIRQIAGVYNVVVTGDVTFQRFANRRTHFYEENPGSERFGQLCSSFSPDAIWYLSGYADDGNGLVDEVRMVENLMESASKCNAQKVIFVASAESMEVLSLDKEITNLLDVSTKAFCCTQIESYAKYLAKKNNLALILLRVPYIAKNLNEENYLGSIFSALEEEEEIRLPRRGEQHIDFLSLSDLFRLLVAITEEKNEAEEEYTVSSGFRDTVDKLQEKIKSVVPSARIGHEDRETFLTTDRLESAGRILRKKYGFVPTDHMLDCFEELYQNYQNREQRGSRFWNRIREALGDGDSLLLKLVERDCKKFCVK